MSRLTPIAQVRGGEVLIAGRVRLVGAPLIAPLSGERCVAYSTKIVRWVYRRGLVFGRGVGHVGRCARFTVDDGTGIAEVEPATALEMADDGRYMLDGPEHDAELMKLLAEWGIETESGDFLGVETFIADGEPVIMAGHATWKPAADGIGGGYREPPLKLFVRGSPELRLKRPQTPG